MTTDTALIEKREELKRRLAAGEYKTLVDVFLAGIDRIIRKITKQSKPLPIWYTTSIFILTIQFIVLAGIYISGDISTPSNIMRRLGLGPRASLLLPRFYYLFFASSLVIVNQYIGRIFVFWGNEVLDATESLNSLEGFEGWLEKACDRRLHLLVTIGGALLGGLYLANRLSNLLGLSILLSPAGYSITFAIIFLLMFFYAFVYFVLIVVFLSARLRWYDLRLFVAGPVNSEVIFHLSNILNFIVYFIAVFATCNVALSALTGLLPLTGFLQVLLLWLPIIAMFILIQSSLSSIIRRAKWITLNKIQAKVEKLQAVEDFEDKENMEAINRLMDYHDRIKATRNSTIDLGIILGLINSLLLPLLAFLLGNIDLVLKLFGINP